MLTFQTIAVPYLFDLSLPQATYNAHGLAFEVTKVVLPFGVVLTVEVTEGNVTLVSADSPVEVYSTNQFLIPEGQNLDSVKFNFHFDLRHRHFFVFNACVKIPADIIKNLKFGEAYPQNIIISNHRFPHPLTFNAFWTRTMAGAQNVIFQYFLQNQPGVLIEGSSRDYTHSFKIDNIKLRKKGEEIEKDFLIKFLIDLDKIHWVDSIPEASEPPKAGDDVVGKLADELKTHLVTAGTKVEGYIKNLYQSLTSEFDFGPYDDSEVNDDPEPVSTLDSNTVTHQSRNFELDFGPYDDSEVNDDSEPVSTPENTEEAMLSVNDEATSDPTPILDTFNDDSDENAYPNSVSTPDSSSNSVVDEAAWEPAPPLDIVTDEIQMMQEKYDLLLKIKDTTIDNLRKDVQQLQETTTLVVEEYEENTDQEVVSDIIETEMNEEVFVDLSQSSNPSHQEPISEKEAPKDFFVVPTQPPSPQQQQPSDIECFFMTTDFWFLPVTPDILNLNNEWKKKYQANPSQVCMISVEADHDITQHVIDLLEETVEEVCPGLELGVMKFCDRYGLADLRVHCLNAIADEPELLKAYFEGNNQL